jgi:predicted DNA repair protein MutK
MSQKCVFTLFFGIFFQFYKRKKIALLIIIFTGIVCLCVFHIHAKFYPKKITHIQLFDYAQKNQIMWPGLVSWLVSLYVCLLVGLLLGNLVVFFCILFS